MSHKSQAMLCVIGGINIDIEGSSEAPLMMNDSNPGVIRKLPGGVGRNIADMLSRLNKKTKMVSVVGDDADGQAILNKMKDQGIDVSDVAIIQGERTSTYLYILNSYGEMVVAVSDMGIMKKLDKDHLKACLHEIDKCPYTIVDANLSDESLAFVCERIHHSKLIFESVSTTKVMKIKQYLHNFYMIKLNLMEAEALLDRVIDKDEALFEAGEQLIEMGVSSVIITMGTKGVYYHDGNKAILKKAYTVSPISVNGAGDALLAGFVYGLSSGYEAERCLSFGLATAAFCVQSPLVVPDTLTIQLVEQFIKEKE